MDAPDLLRLAEEALPWIGKVASSLVREKGNPLVTSFGELCKRLCIFAIEARNHRRNERAVELRAMHNVLEEVEKAVTWPKSHSSAELPTLWQIIEIQEPNNSNLSCLRTLRRLYLQFTVKRSLRGYVGWNSEMPHLFKLMELFPASSENRSTRGELRGSNLVLTKKQENFPVYPREISSKLHNVLELHIRCYSCGTAQHLTRLRLKPSEVQDNDMVQFEILFSASSPSVQSDNSIEWRETKILVSRHDTQKKQPESLNMTPFAPSHSKPAKPFIDVEPGSFCKLLEQKHGPILRFEIDDTTLRKLDNEDHPIPRAKSAESLSLSSLFKLREMSRRKKCILAFELAKSVYQYYESDCMKAPWTHEDIHLLYDHDATQKSGELPDRTSSPYLSLSFNDWNTKISEYCDAENAMHRYPKVLALGVLLIEIAQGSTLEHGSENLSFDPEGIRKLFTSAWVSLCGCTFGDDFYPAYTEAVQNCLKRDLFAGVQYSLHPSKSDDSLESRRRILYNKVVLPLKGLLEGTGWSRGLDEIEQETSPQPPKMERTLTSASTTLPVPVGAVIEGNAAQPYDNGQLECGNAAISEAALLSKIETSPSEAWLKSFQDISRTWKFKTQNENPIKIAVLDTGYDTKASLFRLPEIRQSVTWKDMVDDKSMPMDEDSGNHGTRIISVLLRIIPNAKVYGIRIASHQNSLHSSHEKIAEAIIYAAEYLDVDIISMSFGFENNVTKIEKAINKARDIKDGSVVFLAAAGNDGANSRELFPARLHTVISIRGTDHTGKFISSLNPSPYFDRRQPIYGTLGKNVPYAWPDKKASKTMTGCSIATPIAATIVALIMNCAAGKFHHSDQKLLRTPEAILEVFKYMTADDQNGRYYLAPWELFEKKEDYRVAILTIAIRKLPVRD